MDRPSPPADPLSDPEERRVLLAALDSFRRYRRAAHFNTTHVRREAFFALPSAHVELLSAPPFALPRTFDVVDRAIDRNADLAEAILRTGLASFGLEVADDSWPTAAKPGNLDKASSTITQMYRDWSAEGAPERHASHSDILRAVESTFADVPAGRRHRRRVLVPGAGLGRLVFELCVAGFTVEGNEISYHQLLASNYILNCTRAAGQHELHPFVTRFNNVVRRENQWKCVTIPDVHPASTLQAADEAASAEVPCGERMSMTSGDFSVLYRQPEYRHAFDAVTTCFFIDTAPNIISYIETIHHCLETGGVWINLGPLLWHFDGGTNKSQEDKRSGSGATHAQSGDYQGIGEPGSFELSHEEVMALVTNYGFEILEQKQSPSGATGYVQDPNSLLQNVYRPMFWIAQKR